MAAIRVLAIRKGAQPQLAYFQQGQSQPDLRRLRRSLRQYVRQHGRPHHFKVQVVVGTDPAGGPVAGEPTFFGPLGTALPPSREGNGLRLFASRPLSRRYMRDSAIAFLTPHETLAQQVLISSGGRVDSHPMVVSGP